MPIDLEFPKNHKPMGKYRCSDKEHFHFVCGPGKVDALSSTDENIQNVYMTRGKKYVLISVHETFVAVDWDSCISDGGCIEVCPVQVYQWYEAENDEEFDVR